MPADGRRAALALLLVLCGCTKRLYEGPGLPSEQVATLHVGNAIIREIDGQKRRGGALDVGHFEVTPGAHRVTLVFELPARAFGLKTLPAQPGEGSCVFEFTAVAGRQYYLGSRARGDSNSPHWNGTWEGWVRDPSVQSDDDVIARCTSQPVPEEGASPTRVAAAAPLPSPTPAVAPNAAAPVAAAAPPAAPSPVPPAPALPPAAAAPRPPATIAPAVVVPRSASPTIAPPSAASAIRLGEWNLRALGRSPAKDYARIAAVIDADVDILVVTEVLRVGTGHPGYDALLRALGPTWAGMITDTPRPNTPAEGAEYYAILYRRASVRACAGWEGLRYVSDDDSSGRSANADHFLREPAFGCFEAGPASAPSVDFLLAAYHARWAEGDAADVAAEAAYLGDVFAAMKLARPGEEDLIIAGDFNLESVELAQVTRAADRTHGDGSVLNLLGNRTPRLTDHILVFDPGATAELFGDAEVLDVRGAAESNAEFYRTVSDHLPIVLRIRASGSDDD